MQEDQFKANLARLCLKIRERVSGALGPLTAVASRVLACMCGSLGSIPSIGKRRVRKRKRRRGVRKRRRVRRGGG